MVEIINQQILTREYKYDAHYFPHDVEVTEYTTGKTRISVARDLLSNCVVVERSGLSDGINAVRDMFPNCYFDEGKCFIGLSRLAQYRREYDDKNGVFKAKPYHNSASNVSDALRYLAIKYKEITAPRDIQNVWITDNSQYI